MRASAAVRHGRVLVLALGLVLLAGCSGLRLAYDNADLWVRWRADQYLDLHGEKRDRLHARIAEFLTWHRDEALPHYARGLEGLSKRMSEGLSRDDLVRAYDEARVQLARDVGAAASRLAETIDTLDAGQIEHLERRFAEDNRKFAGEFLSGGAESRRAKRAERTVERLEDWLGRLNEAQRDRVRRHSNEQPLIDELRDRERKRLQSELLAIARAHAAREKLPALAQQIVPGHGDPKYVAVARAYVDAYIDLLVDIDRLATARQRERAVVRLHGYARDLASLSLARKDAPAAR
jgi:hypothetical protein